MRHPDNTRDRWSARLSEYLDGDLTWWERHQIEKHLSTCAACTTELEGLRLVLTRARGLVSRSEPAGDLWPGIQSRLNPRPHTPTHGWSPVGDTVGWRIPRLAAAATLALVVVAGLVWIVQRDRDASPPPSTPTRAAAPLAPAESERAYEDAVADLRRTVHARLTEDPRVLEVIEENLAVLDVAIAEYRDALSQQPADTDLGARLSAAKRRKLVVLRQAAALAADGVD